MRKLTRDEYRKEIQKLLQQFKSKEITLEEVTDKIIALDTLDEYPKLGE